ncbi:hypothetical protein [uncultured Marinobacter sp.]|uniref:hypothetical protein n=1 Tax=uncultured Marinobacter sp. TaxID=187379 RepID=UPI00258ED261|nr:hypothetical protein [uncultured Marinobacter sp.]
MLAHLLMFGTLIPSVIVFFAVLRFTEWWADKKHAKMIEDGLRRHTAKTAGVLPAMAAGLGTWALLLELIQPALSTL